MLRVLLILKTAYSCREKVSTVRAVKDRERTLTHCFHVTLNWLARAPDGIACIMLESVSKPVCTVPNPFRAKLKKPDFRLFSREEQTFCIAYYDNHTCNLINKPRCAVEEPSH